MATKQKLKVCAKKGCKNAPLAYHSYCRTCRNAQMRKYRKSKKWRAYQRKNQPQITEQVREWRAKNKEVA